MAKKRPRRVQPPGRGQTPCRHCGEAEAVRPRRMCWLCYYDPKIRRLYPHVSKRAEDGSMRETRFSGTRRKARKRTDCAPGTPGKIDVIMARLYGGQELWRPDDRPIDLD